MTDQFGTEMHVGEFGPSDEDIRATLVKMINGLVGKGPDLLCGSHGHFAWLRPCETHDTCSHIHLGIFHHGPGGLEVALTLDEARELVVGLMTEINKLDPKGTN